MDQTFIGRLGGDPEARNVGDRTVTKISIAVDQDKGQPPMWISVDIWGKRGEIFAEHHRKGDSAIVSGQLRRVDKDGKTYLNLKNSNFTFVPREKKEQRAEPEPYDAGKYEPPGEDDIPF